MTEIATHDHLRIPVNNLLDGREYEEYLGFLHPNELREGDVITDGIGTYQIAGVGPYAGAWDHSSSVPGGTYVQHIRVKHTLAGPIMGGLLRGLQERVHILARRRVAA